MIDILKNTIMFRSFKKENLIELSKMTNIIHLKTGEVLFQQGQKFECFYYVITGTINLKRVSEQGNENVIEIMKDGDFFAESLMFINQSRYPVCSTANKSSTLIAINAKAYLNLINESKDATLLLLGDFSRRIHQLVSQIDEVTFYTSKSRAASYLLTCSESNGGKSFTFDAPKNIIASKLTMKPETFSRALHLFAESGFIIVKKNVVEILDRKAITAFISKENS